MMSGGMAEQRKEKDIIESLYGQLSGASAPGETQRVAPPRRLFSPHLPTPPTSSSTVAILHT